MREILFRGKRIDNGKWVYGIPVPIVINCYDKGVEIIEEDGIEYDELDYFHPLFSSERVIPESAGQFTGLYDKNGVKIFEGDICRFREWSNGDMCWIGKVHYEHQQFVISGEKNKECATPFTLVMSRFISENIEVIGNIYDNPELLNL